ncbi:MAG: leucine-rich repeat domain-containing protein [Saprospiraceae bacterium]
MKQSFIAFGLLSLCLFNLELAANNAHPNCTCNPVADSLELVKLYQNLDGDNWTNKDNWLVPGMPLDTWYGVEVDGNGCVKSLYLGSNKLQGSLYDIQLENLTRLLLDYNQISGQIPDFSGLPNLEDLRLALNQLTGNIPDFSFLPKLKWLFLGRNQLDGAISDFSGLPNLIYLSLGENQLSGTIPDFSNIPLLQTLDISGNPLQGPIPDFSHFPNLTQLFIQQLHLGGEVPDFSHLSKIEWLALGDNQFTGTVRDFSNMPTLKNLFLNDNELTGTVPDFSNLPNLEYLVLDHNPLTGSIPDFLNLPSLKNLTINYTGISGEIPDFTHLPLLEFFQLTSTEISGSIPDFSNLPNLRRLSLDFNHLSGSIPDFSNLPLLEEFSTSRNQVSGPIPDFTNVPKLNLLALSECNVSGPIPDFTNLPMLEYLLLGANQLSGSIPDFSNLPLLKTISFNGNILNGSIPDFSNLPQLSYLNLKNCNLSGPIPDFSNLPLLSLLDLSVNHLDGQIPQFANTPNMYYLDVSDNELRGVIPDLPVLDYYIEKNRFTFSDILPNGNIGNPAFQYRFQKEFYKDTTILALRGQPVAIELGIDENLTDNSYYWTKNKISYTVPPGNDVHSNKLLISNPKATDAGRYVAEALNPQVPNLFLYSYPINLQVCDEALDSLELVKLFNNTGGANWTNKTNWLVPGQAISTWYGVNANVYGCVQKLDLSQNNLIGTLPALNLNTLDTLILEANALQNAIPEMNTPFIRLLNLKNNQLSGGFPNVLSTWMDMRAFNVSENYLSGPIPPILGDLCELTALQMNNNQIEGELPEELTMLVNLQPGQVDFSNNLIDSLADKIIWFCPFGDTILEINPSYDRFLGICNVQCTGNEWNNLSAFPWIVDTIMHLNCAAPGCQVTIARAGFVQVRGISVFYTTSICFTNPDPKAPVFSQKTRFFDCAGHLLETVVTNDENEFITSYNAIEQGEFTQLNFDQKWQCGESLPGIVSATEEADPEQGKQIFEHSKTLKFHCSPNPANAFINCAANDVLEKSSLQIFDLLGRFQSIPNQWRGEDVLLDVSRLPVGLYFVTVKGQQGHYLAKVLVE